MSHEHWRRCDSFSFSDRKRMLIGIVFVTLSRASSEAAAGRFHPGFRGDLGLGPGTPVCPELSSGRCLLAVTVGFFAAVQIGEGRLGFGCRALCDARRIPAMKLSALPGRHRQLGALFADAVWSGYTNMARCHNCILIIAFRHIDKALTARMG